MAKHSISLPVIMVAGVPTVDPAVLTAKLAEFAANPGNFRDLAQTEEYLNACVPIGIQRTKLDLLMGIGRWTDKYKEQLVVAAKAEYDECNALLESVMGTEDEDEAKKAVALAEQSVLEALAIDTSDLATKVGDGVTELLTEGVRFKGQKGRKGGYTRVS